jgi:hypothetical protein
VTRKVRRDWDPDAPGLRGEWEKKNAPLLKALARKAGRAGSPVGATGTTDGRI